MDKYEILEKAYLDKLFIPGTDGCPRNKLGLSDKSLLKKFESQYFTRRSLNIPEGNLSTNHLKEIHRHLFQDV